MKHGILDALRHAATTGEMPVPGAAPPRLSDFRDQLEASVAERENGRRPSTVPTVRTEAQQIQQPQGGQPLQRLDQTVVTDPGLGGRARTARQVPRRPVGQGMTIEAALGEDVAAAPTGNSRASDDDGEGYRQVTMAEFARASRGEPIDPEETEAKVEAALRAEVRGTQALPLEIQMVQDAPGSSTWTGTVPQKTAEALGLVAPTPGVITYDLPTDLTELPRFCFVCGPAGTGKTWQAKAWARHNPGVTLAATTGIAAVNLGEGTTINSLLKFYNTASLVDAYTGGWLEAQLTKLRRAGLQTIVLDEVSMLDGEQLTVLCRALDNVNEARTADDPEMGLVLVGDFAQLPPVKAPFAFESAEWARFAKATYGLTTIRRQAEVEFVQALQAVRKGDADGALDYFLDRFEQVTQQQFDGTTVLAKNDQVDRYNQLRLDKVTGPAVQFESSRWGKLRPEWGGDPKPPSDWGVPKVLKLKIGATVMILANHNIAEKGEPPVFEYVNGDCGTVVDSQYGMATVELKRTGSAVTVGAIERTNTIPLEPGRRKALTAEGHPERVDGKHEVIGAVTYMPLRLSYSTTVHKSQGLTLDNVQVNIRDHFFSEAGMIYVALSRARTIDGLRLVGTAEGFRARCKTSPKVTPWL